MIFVTSCWVQDIGDGTLNGKCELLNTATNLAEIGVYIRRPMLMFLQSPARCHLDLLQIYAEPSKDDEWILYEEVSTLDVMAQAKIEIFTDIEI